MRYSDCSLWSPCCGHHSGLPINSGENNRTLDFDSYSRTTSASAAQPRVKGESTDERKQRKTAVKEAKVLSHQHILMRFFALQLQLCYVCTTIFASVAAAATAAPAVDT